MADSQFNYKRIRNELGITNDRDYLFPHIIPCLPSDWLQNTLLYVEDVALFSEKARSEGIV